MCPEDRLTWRAAGFSSDVAEALHRMGSSPEAVLTRHVDRALATSRRREAVVATGRLLAIRGEVPSRAALTPQMAEVCAVWEGAWAELEEAWMTARAALFQADDGDGHGPEQVRRCYPRSACPDALSNSDPVRDRDRSPDDQPMSATG